MKTKYLDFLKLNEKNNNLITISEIEKVFKEVFDESKVSSVKTLFDKDDETDSLKLIITINNLFYKDNNILFTKFIFLIDKTKQKLVKNSFNYLYDINTNFKKVNFNDIEELKIELYKILDGELFGTDIKKLSDLSVHMTSNVNKWLNDNEIDTLSVYNIKYQPLVDNIPSDSLFFRFEINIEDSDLVELNIRKNDENEFKLSFNKGDWFHHITLSDINGTIQAIGETIKNYII